MANAEILQQNGYNFLWINNGHGPELWMWDVPEEVEAQEQIAQQAYGDVLVAGYGLGLVQRFLLENPRVKTVLTVELEQSVVEVCQSTFDQIHGEVTIGDFLDFETQKTFDCVVGDIWTDITPKAEHLDRYRKFKEKALTVLKPNGKLIAWGMDYFEHIITKNGD